MTDDRSFYAGLRENISLLQKATFKQGLDGIRDYVLSMLLSAEKIEYAEKELESFCDDFEKIPSFYDKEPSAVRENKHRFTEVCDLLDSSFVRFFSLCGHPPKVLGSTLSRTKREVFKASTISEQDPLFVPIAKAIDITAEEIKPDELRKSIIDILQMERSAHPLASPASPSDKAVFINGDQTLTIRLTQNGTFGKN